MLVQYQHSPAATGDIVTNRILRLVSEVGGFYYFALGQKYMYGLTANREVYPTPLIVRRSDVYKVLHKSRPYIVIFRGHYSKRRRGDPLGTKMHFSQIWNVTLRKNGDTRIGCTYISKSQLKIIARWSKQ